MYIALEGIDGVGKSWCINQLEQLFPSVVFTREPLSRPPLGIDPIELCYHFAADRHVHMRDVIIPSLEQRKVIVSDRSVYSNLVYQVAQGVSPVFIRSIQPPNMRWPEMVVWIDGDPNEAHTRSGDPRHKEHKLYNRKLFQCKVQRVEDSFEAFDTLKEWLEVMTKDD